MNCPAQMLNCDLGLYRIYWKSGGSSLASVGNSANGDRWFAATNWINGSVLMKNHVTWIERMEKIV